MKILFVLNNIYTAGNGLVASARRTVAYLREAGHEVRIVSGPNHKNPEEKPDYLLQDYIFPIVQPIIASQGYQFSQSDLPLMEEAAKWADIVHLEEPFVIEDRMIKICKKLGKPVTCTYHLHPENITNSLGPLVHWKALNRKILTSWRDLTFNHCDYVQCPTENVLDRLRRYHIKTPCEVISNGLVPDACIRPETPPADYESPERPLKLVYIGRLSREKDQPTLLEAMKFSRFAKRIQLCFAGLGPSKKKIKRMAHRLYKTGVLAYEPIFTFEDRDGLRKLAARPTSASTAPPSRWKASPSWKPCSRVPFPSLPRADTAAPPSLRWTAAACSRSRIRRPSPTASTTGSPTPRNAGKWARNTSGTWRSTTSGNRWTNWYRCFRKLLIPRQISNSFAIMSENS